jgi:transcriptional regulator with XRE-family HTH domain
MPELRRIMSLPEAIYNTLTGRSQRSADRMNTRGRASEMMRRYGSTRRIADAVGVSRRTVQRWLRGQQEAKNTRRARTADALENAQRAARVTPGRASQWAASATAPGAGRTGAGGLSIYGTIRVSDDERDRWINPGTRIPQGDLDDFARVFAQQGPDAAADMLHGLIDQHYCAGMEIITVEIIDF